MTPFDRVARAAAFVAAAGLSLTVTACASSQPAAPAGPGGAADTSAPVQPKVNRLVMALPAPNVENNETRHLDQPQIWQLRPGFEYLVAMDPQSGKFAPGLATEWKLEGQSYRFKLRQGVQVHRNLGEFTAKDVVFTWKDFVQNDSMHGQAPQFRKEIKDIQVVNDYEVVIQLTEPDGNFLHALGEPEGGMEVVSKADFDKRGAPTMQTMPYAGTAPYEFKERQQGAFIRFSRVPYKHWRVNPDFPEFEFRYTAEPSTRLAALLTGEVQLTPLPQDLQKQAERQGMKTITGKVPGLRMFMRTHCCMYADGVNPEKGMKYPDSPLWDVRVRKALDKAINKDELNKAYFGGKGTPIIVNHFNPTRPGWNPDWEKRYQEEYGYDPEKAKALLAEAGYGPNKKLPANVYPITLPAFPGTEDVAESIANYWRAVGVDVTMVQMSGADYEQRRRTDAFPNLFTMVATSSDLFIAQVYTGLSAGRSLTGAKVVDPALDKLVDQVYVTLDEQKQDAMWRQIGESVFTLHQTVNLFWLPAEVVSNPKFVDSWLFPGSITGTWTHVENVKAAR